MTRLRGSKKSQKKWGTISTNNLIITHREVKKTRIILLEIFINLTKTILQNKSTLRFLLCVLFKRALINLHIEIRKKLQN